MHNFANFDKIYRTTMTGIPYLSPTIENTYVLTYPDMGNDRNRDYDFAYILKVSREMERNGDIKKACDMRYEAFQRLLEIIPENEEVVFDWEDEDNQSAINLIHSSAIDHFLVGDFELAAGMLELLLDIDPEDHSNATQPLAYCYVVLEEYELFDEIIDDISDKYPEKEILKMWSEFNRKNEIPVGEMFHFKKSFPVFYKEFTCSDHEITDQYLKDIDSERPSKETLARELWLQTEHIWNKYPAFIEALKKG